MASLAITRTVLVSVGVAALAAPAAIRAPTDASLSDPEFAAGQKSALPDRPDALAAKAPRPAIRLTLPETRPAYRVTSRVAAPDKATAIEIAAMPAAPLILDIPAPGEVGPEGSVERQHVLDTGSPVTVAQLADAEDSSAYIAQLNQPSSALAVSLADNVATMQVGALPPTRVSQTDRVAMLAEAPDRLTVRQGEASIGSLAVRIASDRSVSIELTGLIELFSSRLPVEDMAAFRNSEAASAFVPLDTLRAAGINLRYDPVYDEFRLPG